MFDRLIKILCTTAAALALLCSLSSAFGAEAEPASQQAAAILRAAEATGGLVVHLGCARGELTAALCADQRYLVQGLDAEADNVAAAREYLQSRRLYGRVSVRQWQDARLPYGDNLVNLLVISPGFSVDRTEIERVLRPDGVAVMLDAKSMPQKIHRKAVPKEIDQWTHYLHDAGNNAVAEDDRVGPPHHLQWKAGPMWCRSHEFSSSVQTLISADGRLIGVIDEGIIGQPRGVPALWTLIARDAFNGILLWRRPCDHINPHALVASRDRVYVTLQARGPLCILDAATGETLHTCEWTGKVDQIAYCDQRLILSTQLAGPREQSGPHLVAADPEDGHLLWKRPVKAVAGHGLAVGEERVCYFDNSALGCLALKDGSELWRRELSSGGKGRGYLMLYQGVVLLAGSSTRAFSLETGEPLWTGPSGSSHARNPPGLFGAGGLIWPAWEGGGSGRSFIWQHREETRHGYDPLTGEVRKTVTVPRLVSAGHHIRCYPPKATKRYLLLNKRGVEFFDLEGTNHMRANWTRGACGFGMLPANGFLYTPPSQCFCYPGVLVPGLNALASARETPQVSGSAAQQRAYVEKGPAFEEAEKLVAAGDPRPTDWPTYRHDALRSGTIDADLPAEPVPVWRVSLAAPAIVPSPQTEGSEEEEQAPALREYAAGALTPPVAAEGRLFVAEPDAHLVHALDARDGKRLWSFTADGRVDSPPTIYRGLCIFGCTDGHVYCLSTAQGRLVWRFQAAPEERQICVMDQLESAWPVHGSVLVRHDKVYCTAGRSSYLDGGIYLYALDPRTGRVLHEHLLHSPEPDVSQYGGRPFDIEGARSDILVAGPKDVYLFQNRFDAQLKPQPMPRVTKLGDRWCEPHLMTTDGFLDKTWFNRTYWTYSGRWPGYYFTYRGPKSGQILCFDHSTTYALKVYTERRGHSPEFQPGSGYLLMADRNTTEPVLDEMDIGAEKGRGFTRTELPIWARRIPIRVEGMVLARDRLYVCGPPDLLTTVGAYEAMIGKRGATFRVVSTADGAALWEFELDEAPVFDGLIAAGDRLYMTTLQGSVICLGGKK